MVAISARLPQVNYGKIAKESLKEVASVAISSVGGWAISMGSYDPRGLAIATIARHAIAGVGALGYNAIFKIGNDSPGLKVAFVASVITASIYGEYKAAEWAEYDHSIWAALGGALIANIVIGKLFPREDPYKNSKVLSVNAENFQKEVLESDKPVVVDVYASWSRPSRVMVPIIEELNDEMKETVKIVSLNVNENLELTRQYGIEDYPTFLFFNKGEVLHKHPGAKQKDVLKNEINDAFNLTTSGSGAS
jgi:thioredoxin 1